jgi:hypothetical protein
VAGTDWAGLILQSCSRVLESYLLFAIEQTAPNDERNKLYLPILSGAENNRTLV